jgi:hypothetical protein
MDGPVPDLASGDSRTLAAVWSTPQEAALGEGDGVSRETVVGLVGFDGATAGVVLTDPAWRSPDFVACTSDPTEGWTVVAAGSGRQHWFHTDSRSGYLFWGNAPDGATGCSVRIGSVIREATVADGLYMVVVEGAPEALMEELAAFDWRCA